MTRDAFDPGPNGDYPWWPRDAEGRPILGPGAEGRMPTGLTSQRGRLIDVTPRHPDGTPIVPPTIPPEDEP